MMEILGGHNSGVLYVRLSIKLSKLSKLTGDQRAYDKHSDEDDDVDVNYDLSGYGDDDGDGA